VCGVELALQVSTGFIKVLPRTGNPFFLIGKFALDLVPAWVVSLPFRGGGARLHRSRSLRGCCRRIRSGTRRIRSFVELFVNGLKLGLQMRQRGAESLIRTPQFPYLLPLVGQIPDANAGGNADQDCYESA